MNILFISNHAGFSKFNAPYINELSRTGFKVYNASPGIEVVCECEQFDVPISRTPISFGNVISFFKLSIFIYRKKIDVIHCHTPSGGVIGRLLKICKPTLKIIYTAHGFHFFKGSSLLGWLIYFPIEFVLSFLSNAIITINNEDFIIAKKYFRSLIYRIDGVGVDLARFRPDGAAYVSGRGDLNIGSNIVVYICVAQFIERKNHQLLLNAFKILSEDRPESILLLVGSGPKMDLIRETADKLSLGNKVLFLGYRSDVDRLYQLSNILVSASYQEGFAINLVEGLASGLPIVVTDIRGHNDVCANCSYSYLVKDFEVNEFSDKMKQAFDLVRADEFNKNLCVNEAMKFSIHNSLHQVIMIYKEIF